MLILFLEINLKIGPACIIDRSMKLLNLLDPSVACFCCRMPFERMVGRGKVFGLNTLRRRKILPETALPPDLSTAISAMRYLCIRVSGTGD